MSSVTQLLSNLEHARQPRWKRGDRKDALNHQLLSAWIFHDLLLEGEGTQPEEIRLALEKRDRERPPYFGPLFERIREYRRAVDQIWTWSGRGLGALNLQQATALHRRLMSHAPAAGAQMRTTSPVHRDYHQPIRGAKGLKDALQSCFARARKEAEDAPDPIAFAAAFHHELMFLYPFRERPGCFARLLTNLLLLSQGYPPLILLSQDRFRYYDALASHNSAQLAQLFYETMKSFLELKVPLTEREVEALRWTV